MPSLRRAGVLRTSNRPAGAALACVLLVLLAIACIGASSSQAAVTCPNSNPVVNENQCKTGSSSWQVFDYSKDLGGFTTKTSVDLGEDVVLKIGRNASVTPTKTVNIDVYRMGYYNGDGARLVKSATNVAINNDFTCKAMDQTTGEVDCGNWSPTYTIPASSFPASGVYLAKLTASTGDQTQVVFTVRDDDRSAKMLFVLPIADYQAYNTFGGKSLYFGNLAGDTVGDQTPATGTDRAAKVSFNRPFSQAGAMQNWLLGPDYDLLYWMEKQGYDVSYTDEVAVHTNPGQLLDHDVDVVSGHSEYWSLEEFNGFKAARAAGVNIASFGANTAYWKVRYENGGRTLVCYKTVQGSGSGQSGAVSQNDWGPDGLKGTADDALGLDGKAGTADDNPQNSTTTFRDNGAPEGDPNAPPQGRVGPDMPENELWGILYMGDDDAFSWPLTVPPTNGQGEYAGDRIWRNAGIPQNSTSKIGTRIVNWEWDAVPTQPQYLAHQPANVVKLSSTAIENGSGELNWLLDEGRMRSKVGPPPGQPNTVNAVKYKAASGALVFASGTMLWSHGLSNEAQAPIQQATYNIFSDMGVQPATPEEDVVLDPGGSNQAPNASFTVSPNPVKTATTVTFNGAASSDPNGTIAKYEWDLDGDGIYETNTGTKSSTTRTYSLENEYLVRLKVTDNGGATDFATRTLRVINNQPPSASFTSSPTSPVTGEAVSFNGSGSKDPDGTIAKYEWDLDGNGSYETNTGSSSSASRTYTAAGDYNVKLRVTDNGGKTAISESVVSIASNGVSNYSPTVMATPGLAHYWRLNETAGTKFADSAGSSPATIAGAPTLGVIGGVPNDADKAARFKGGPDAASAEVNLSGTQAVTVEFWLKWNSYANDDAMAMEFTKNFNDIGGGFLVDPNAPQLGGTFGVGIGQGTARNNVFFTRPTAGAWHHYAFAIDTTAPAAQEIVPYVDGQPVAYTKLDNGNGGGFANSTLNFMSRATSSYFGAGDLDEVAIYERALNAQEIDEHFNSDSGNKRPQASFTAPAAAKAGDPVAFDASASKDPDGTIAKYEWDLDGNGSYETNTGTIATVSKTYAASGNVKVGLRVTDNAGSTGVAFRTVAIEGAEEPEGEEKTSNYSPTVLSTPGLMHYWRMNESSGPSFADSVGGVTATTAGGPTLGVPGGVPNDTDKAARFDGSNDSASAPINLAGKTAVTVEFWMKWNAWATDDDLAMEFTNNFNENAGGFLVDPNAPQLGGSFGIGIGAGTSRNNAFFTRPTAGAWHHYAFVLNTQAPAAEQVVPYVDGKAVAYTKLNSGTGAVPFVKSTLYMMSRAGSFLNGAGDLDEVAIYDRALSAATIDEHFNSESGNKRPSPSFTFAPPAPKVGETVSFDASGSKDPDGTITKYEWDLDGNGTYETNTGTTASTTQAYAATGVVKVGLRVTDNGAATSTTTRSVTVEAQPGPEEVAGYAESVLGTPGLIDYWRLGEPSGSIFADAVGTNNAAIVGNPILGVAGGVPHDSDKAARFDGVDDAASAPVGLGGKTAATVEFWLKADSWNNEDDLALELTNNFNSAPGGFIVDPNSSYGSFAVGIGIGASRNVSVFPRPSTGVWHHYAFVLDTQAAAANQVIPYVDGQPVAYTKVESGTGAPAFASAALNFMSRAETKELNAAGDLDEVALYDRALSPATIANHFQGQVDNKRPIAVLQAPATAQVGATVNFSASGSSDPDGTIAKYEWDLDGNGTYETDSGTTPSTSRVYTSPTTLKVGLRVTDNGGSAASASRLISIEGEEPVEEEPETPPAGPSYAEGVAATPGLVDFWRLGESSGSTFADGVGGNPATIAGGPTLGIASAVPGDSDKAASFDGNDDAASAAVSGLAGKTAATVEFWMKWDSYDSDDDLAMEFTNNFNDNAGGFLIDPDSGYGSFAVGLGIGASRNVSLFARPSIGTWHHYAFVLDTQAAAEQQIVPYVDGQAVAFTKAASGVGAPAFANAALNFMSRAASSLNGAGDLDEVALYDRALNAKTVADHFALAASNTAPTASFTASPNPAATGATVSFDASASKDSDGTIAKYEWDLDGNGTYETDSGTTPSTSRAYASPGERTIGLRVSDDDGARTTTTRNLTVQNTAPTASFTASPSPVQTGKAVTLDGAASSDADGSVSKYEWDLDGNGTYETDGGASATTTTSYAAIGQRTIGLRVTDNNGATATTTRSLTVLNSAPTATFTATPNPAATGTTISFNAGGSSDSDGTVVKYEWDLDGNGSFETNGGASATTTKSFASAGARTIGLRVTDNNGGTATATQALTITNRAPSASFTTTPSTAQSGVAISFNAAASSDPDGTLIKYEWDFDGNGTYETDAGGVATTSKAFAAAGTVTVGLRVTDNNGDTATTTRTVTITNAPPTASFTASPNPAPTGTAVAYNASASVDPDGTIAKYEWDLDGNGTYETSTGTTASASSSYATVGARTIRLRVTDNAGATAISSVAVTITNRAPEASFSASPNPIASGGSTTLNASASKDPDGTIAKYEWDLDNNGSYEINSGSTSSTTRSFSLSGERTIGLRVTDNLGATATTTRILTVTNKAPTASFTVSPTSAATGATVTLNGGGSTDSDGTIAKYEWDFDNNGSYDATTTTSSTTTSYATAGGRTIGLRVTDNLGATATTTRTVTITNRAPTATFTTSPNPALAGANITFNASGSVDPDGTIAKYEWDLDNNGTYEVNGGTTPTTVKSFSPAGDRTIRLRVTDNNGAATVDTETLSVRGTYNNAVLSTAGLIDYWRLGETSGSTLANSVSGGPSASREGATQGLAGNLTLDGNTALSFNGSSDDAYASLNLSGTQVLTLEFWLKWTSFSNNDDLAFEFTSNFNNSNGGFIVNPNSSTSSGRFEVALGRGGSRNNAYFTRPSANVWHHYAIVLNTAAAAASQITVYVDGAPVSIVKGSSGTGAGAFANSTLNLMSRNGSSLLSGTLFGAGTLDEVAIYSQALSAAQVSQHYAAK